MSWQMPVTPAEKVHVDKEHRTLSIEIADFLPGSLGRWHSFGALMKVLESSGDEDRLVVD